MWPIRHWGGETLFNPWWHSVCEIHLRYGYEYSVSHLFLTVVRACSMFNLHEGYRSVTPLDAAADVYIICEQN